MSSPSKSTLSTPDNLLNESQKSKGSYSLNIHDMNGNTIIKKTVVIPDPDCFLLLSSHPSID
ncbi:hypothetical protein DERP_000556 [Dermatophagoides pteronyssinus]|uniref:Uncharacterized protein n=1 Tax=Dermatophagoides pteronyssinus TaxID=6956 RepID=A0ABQ8J0I0_DERPT|nr:hypothetical protein DERP_000556 [Dermatophagoides pteronyssinus]